MNAVRFFRATSRTRADSCVRLWPILAGQFVLYIVHERHEHVINVCQGVGRNIISGNESL